METRIYATPAVKVKSISQHVLLITVFPGEYVIVEFSNVDESHPERWQCPPGLRV